MKKRIRVHGFLITLAVIAVAAFYRHLVPAWENRLPDEIFDYLGLAAVLTGFLVRISARGYKSEMSSDGHRLIKMGLYAFVRNPMYLGTFLIGAGIVSMVFQWWVLIILGAVFWAIYIPEVRKEEKTLGERFGREYKDYCAHTRRFFPNLALWLRSRPSSYLRFKGEWIKRELPSLVAATAIPIGIEMAEDSRLFNGQYRQEALVFSLMIAAFAAAIILCYDRSQPAGKT